MSRIDDDLRRDLHGLRESVDEAAAFRGVASRKRRRRLLQRLQSASLAGLVVLGTAGGVYALSKAFGPTSSPSTRPGSSVGNGLIAFQAFSPFGEEFDSPSVGRLYVVDPSGEEPRELTPDDAEYLTPAWSPDGKQMAIVRLERTDEEAEEGIYVMDADGSDLRHLYSTGLPIPVSVLQLAWSPDGQQIAFIRAKYPAGPGIHSEADDVLQLFVMNADGTGARAITQPDQQVTSFSWSPDGQEIVFTRQFVASENRFGYDLFIMNADGTKVRRVTSDGRSMDPAWSPDGDWIAFSASSPEDPFIRRDIYLVRHDGTESRRLTNHPATDSTPAWAPDGSRIVFDRYGPGDECALMTVTPQGDDETTLVDRDALDGGCASNPAWQSLVGGPEPSPLPGESPAGDGSAQSPKTDDSTLQESSEVPASPPSDRLVLASGEEGGTKWEIFTFEGENGPVLGHAFEGGGWGYTDYSGNQRIDPCEIESGRIYWMYLQPMGGYEMASPPDRIVVLQFNVVPPEADAVRFLLSDGRSVEARILRVPDDLAPWDAFVVVFEGPPELQVDEIVIEAADGTRLDDPAVC